MKVLVSDPITESGMAVLKEAKFEIVHLPNGSPEEKATACKDVHGWIIRSGTKITEEMITSAKNLQVIGRAGVGVDNIDIPAATRRGIVVMNTPDVNTISAAEHTVAMMLTLSRNISVGDRGMKRGEWNRHALVGTELLNKTIGIVGMGKIGREVMTRCHAFGMNILGYDPFVNQEMFNEEEVEIVDLDKLVAQSDFITVHVPLMDSTRDLFDYKRLSSMKPNARIINVARGGIINESDLAKALIDGKISGAAIDVFISEPVDESNPLLNAPNIVLTPHLGASTQEAKEGVSMAVCEQVRDYLICEKLANALNMPISDASKLKEFQVHLDLAEIMGHIQGQLNPGVIKKIYVDCGGSMDESKPAALSFLKGLLKDRVSDRVNYINAKSLAVELGIDIEHSNSTDSGSYTNLIRTTVLGESTTSDIHGSIFQGNQKKLVNILGYEIDITPHGTLVFIQNKDVPGIIGKVGTMLGRASINIGAYFLSREFRDWNDGKAFGVIRVDNPVPEDVMENLQQLPEIYSVRQLEC